jgi:hypothetical protein
MPGLPVIFQAIHAIGGPCQHSSLKNGHRGDGDLFQVVLYHPPVVIWFNRDQPVVCCQIDHVSSLISAKKKFRQQKRTLRLFFVGHTDRKMALWELLL